MAIDSKASKSLSSYSGTDTSGAPRQKASPDLIEMAANLDDSQQLLLRAQQNAVNAKEAAIGAISRFYQESQASEKKAEKMVRELDNAINTALDATKKSPDKVKKDKRPGHNDWGDLFAEKEKKKPLSENVLNNGALSSAVSGLTKSLFGGRDYDAETREEFYRVVMRQSPQLRRLIDDLTEDKAKIKTEKIMTEAKSEIVAARVAVNHAQEEVRDIKEAAKKTMAEAEIIRKTAEVTVSQVKQSALSQIAVEITRANEEVKSIRESADAVVRRAEEEIRKSREQTAAANNHAQVAISLAQEKLKRDAEQVKAARLQAQIIVKQAQDESKTAKEEGEAVRRQAMEAINRASLETKLAQENMEVAKKKIQEASVVAEKQAYDRFCDEIKKIREDADAAKKSAYEAIAKAREESNLAKAEAETMKKAGEEAIFLAKEETRKAREEAERARQSVNEVISQAQEDSRKASAEAEATILQANEAMMQAKQDIINMTRKEMSQARQDLEQAGSFNDKAPSPRQGAGKEAPGQAEKLDPSYVATVLHEMRTPLHSISGFAKLMLEDNVGDSTTQKEFLSLMVQQSESLNRLIDDLSGLLRHQASPFDTNKETVSSQQLIEQAIDGVQGIAQQKKNLIKYNFSSALPEIVADPLRIKQVIINLLTNAIKFSPKDSVITVEAGVLNDELLVQVTDRGSGIAEAEIPHLFSGSRGPKSPDERHGEGLGLYICRQIIEAHGGNIWADSKEGKGSTFSFTLPLPAPVK
ncbi:MAG: ATP-binding protein [Dehalococcoidales bacterium]|jgi:signal transduction histidine kinase